MKNLVILAGAVLLLVGAWILLRRPWEESPSASPVLGTEAPLPKLDGAAVGNAQLIEKSLHALHHAASVPGRGRDCIAYLDSLCERLDDPLWNQAAPQVLQVWAMLRWNPALGEDLGPLESKMTTRFLRTGTSETLEALVKIATQSNRVGDRMKAALLAKAAEPVGPLAGSRHLAILAAAVWAGELSLAKEYSAAVSWNPSAKDGEKVAHDRLDRALDLALRAQSGQANLAAAVSERDGLEKEPAGTLGELGPLASRLLLEMGASVVRAQAPEEEEKLAAQIRQSASGGGDAKGYWDAVARLIGAGAEPLQKKVALLDALFKAYRVSLGRSPAESELWLLLAREKPTSKAREPVFVRVQALECLRRAVASSSSDEKRAELIRELKAAYVSLGRFGAARKVLPEEIARVEDPAKREPLLKLLRDLDDDELSESRRVQDVNRSVAKANLQGQLDHMKNSLAQARKAGRSEEDIRSLENVVKDLEARCAAPK